MSISSGFLSRLGVLLLFFSPFLASCAGKVEPQVYQRSYDMLLSSAKSHLNEGEYGDAYLISMILLDAKPGASEVLDVKSKALAANPNLMKLEHRWSLGSNMALRESRHASVMTKLVCWPFNLVLDLVDVISLEAGVGIGAGLKAEVTDAVSAGAKFSLGETMFGIKRGSLGVRATMENSADILPFEIRGMIESSAGLGRTAAYSYKGTGFKKPSDLPYQRIRDFWAIGAEAQVAVISANVKVHPIQIFDWVAGIFFFDPMNDNMGATKEIKLDEDERDAVMRLLRGEK